MMQKHAELLLEIQRLKEAARQAIAVSTRSGDLTQIRLILREAIGMNDE